MGGGPCEGSDGNEKSRMRKGAFSCCATFPKEKQHPVKTYDCVLIYSLGISFLKQIGQDVLSDQPFGLIHRRSNGTYVAIPSDEALRRELMGFFTQTDNYNSSSHVRRFYLHFIFVGEVSGKIEVGEENPTSYMKYSPQPRALDQQVSNQLENEESTAVEHTEEDIEQIDVCHVQDKLSPFVDPNSDSTKGHEKYNEAINAIPVEVDDEKLQEVHLPTATLVEDGVTELQADNIAYVVVAESEEYVVLNRTELSSTDNVGEINSAEPSFFISASWHLQANSTIEENSLTQNNGRECEENLASEPFILL